MERKLYLELCQRMHSVQAAPRQRDFIEAVENIGNKDALRAGSAEAKGISVAQEETTHKMHSVQAAPRQS